jgi:response regulator RpfG family c-di-GMP phosphodiesterase
MSGNGFRVYFRVVQGSIWKGVLMAEQGSNFAVLYVDNGESSLRAFRRACEDQFRVITASNSIEGLDHLKEHKHEIGVVMAARCMPIRRGTWLLQRARECVPQIVRLLASDGCSLVEEEDSLRDGIAEGIIPIPWDPPELKMRLHAELQRFAVRRGGRPVGVKEALSACGNSKRRKLL